MECPYCKKELPKGKIPAVRDHVSWYPEGEESSPFDDGKVLLSKSGFYFNSYDAEAYYCADCRMVFVVVPEKQETTMDKLKKKWEDISDKMEAASEARQVRQEEERKEKQREKRGKKDPWER